MRFSFNFKTAGRTKDAKKLLAAVAPRKRKRPNFFQRANAAAIAMREQRQRIEATNKLVKPAFE